jgi:ATP-dependent DNA helicase RecG
MPPPSAAQAPDPPAKKPAASGPQRAMERLGLRRPIDLALHLPLRYEDETQRRAPARRAARRGGPGRGGGQPVPGRVRRAAASCWSRCATRRGEPAAALPALLPTQQRRWPRARRLRVRGELRGGFFGFEMVHPAVQDGGRGAAAAALTPVYPASAGLPQAYLRKAIGVALPRAPCTRLLPPAACRRAAAPARCLNYLHHPPPAASLRPAGRPQPPGLAAAQVRGAAGAAALQLRGQAARARQRAPALRGGRQPAEQLLAALPFALTGAQQRVVAEIAADLAQPQPMHRLLQGDVGSGKTVVAALAAAVASRGLAVRADGAHRDPRRAALAQARRLAGAAGRARGLADRQPRRERRQSLEKVVSGEARVVVGTHALFQEHVQFQRLGLVIIDEQHRFGVAQRLALRKKGAPIRTS